MAAVRVRVRGFGSCGREMWALGAGGLRALCATVRAGAG